LLSLGPDLKTISLLWFFSYWPQFLFCSTPSLPISLAFLTCILYPLNQTLLDYKANSYVSNSETAVYETFTRHPDSYVVGYVSLPFLLLSLYWLICILRCYMRNLTYYLVMKQRHTRMEPMTNRLEPALTSLLLTLLPTCIAYCPRRLISLATNKALAAD